MAIQSDTKLALKWLIAAVPFCAFVFAYVYLAGKGSSPAYSGVLLSPGKAAIAFGVLLIALIPLFFLWSDRDMRALLKPFKRAARLNAAANLRADPNGGAEALALLVTQLTHSHGRFWRYRLPWLLLTGDDTAILRLLPDLADTGWLITHDVVLLWQPTAPGGVPDAAWLHQIYRMRRRRPLDAILLTLDGAAPLPELRRTYAPHSITLARIEAILRWRAPLLLLDLALTDPVNKLATPATGFALRNSDAGTLDTALHDLRINLARRSLPLMVSNPRDRYTGLLSEHMDSRNPALAQWIANLPQPLRHAPVSGVFFAPYPDASPGADSRGPDASPGADLPLWEHLGLTVRHLRGRRTAGHPLTITAIVLLAAVGLWSAGMLISGLTNARDLQAARRAVQTLNAAADPIARLRALQALQTQIARYEYRNEHHSLWLTRFGLNRDAQVLDALWVPYACESRASLVAPIQRALEAGLTELAELPAGQLDAKTNQRALEGHDALKTYLMLADPRRVEPGFLAPLLMRYWHAPAPMTTGEQQDLSERLLRFHAQHLGAHPDWRIATDAGRINAARLTLLSVIGVKNSQDTIYQSLLDGAGKRYADQTLASLTSGVDPRGVLRGSTSVPGVFTRQAYDDYIAAAIAETARRSEPGRDWVLVSGPAQANAREDNAPSSQSLQAALTQRYFSDYAQHWQDFMNTLQWEPAPDLTAAIEQLKVMADARQSPLIALMKSLEYQGGAGVREVSLSDTLVARTQNVFRSNDTPVQPSAPEPDPAGPLGVPFGPVLHLVAQNPAARGVSDLSLQRYLERVTALRLRLQQINNSADADAQARQAAQALFQGRGSELADTQAYAQLIGASLGSQWAGMGETLFVRPVTQATQALLQPAQASLNRAWRQTIVATWNRAFAGRYPFADTDNDASLPELARMLRPQGGLIEAFLGSQLAGVLELQGDQWVPVAAGAQTLTFDPAFLRALNTLQRIGVHLLEQGEPHYRFDLMAEPTPGVVDTIFTLDDQALHYYNQRQIWQTVHWPANGVVYPGTRLQWQTEQAGTNKNFEFGGRWAWVRMLERARVEPVDSATYRLTWQGVPDVNGLDEQGDIAANSDRSSSSAASTAAAADPASAPAMASASDPASAVTPDPDRLSTRAPLTAAAAAPAFGLSYLMRTEAGMGPLELLALRGFVLPTRIFTLASAGAPNPAAATVTPSAEAAAARMAAQTIVVPPLPAAPPPLPPELLNRLQRAAMPSLPPAAPAS